MAVAVVLGLLVACSRGTEEVPLPTTPRPGPSFRSGTTMDTIQAAGVLRVGIRSDQPGFGLRNPVTGQVDGFDREIAQLVAQAVFGTGDVEDAFHRIAFKTFPPNDGDRLIAEGEADVVLTAFARDQDPPQTVDFAGPYHLASRDLAVRSGTGPASSADLVGKKVCTANDPGARTEQRGLQRSELAVNTAAVCADALKAGSVAAMSADSAALKGVVESSAGVFRLLDDGHTEESSVLILKKGDETFRAFLNERLEQLFQNGEWASAFDRTLGTFGLARPPPPAITREAAAGTPTTATTTAGGTSTTRR